MKKLLFIYNNPLDGSTGGSLVTYRTYTALSKRYTIFTYSLVQKRNKLFTFLRSVFLYSGGLTFSHAEKIVNFIKRNEIEYIYLDSSLFGRLIKRIKKNNLTQKIIVNFHNNEEKFVYDQIKINGPQYFPLWISAKYNQNLSLKYSDLNIFISNEDRLSMKDYNTPSIIIPVTLEDKYTEMGSRNIDNKSAYVLFIGSAFYANIEGVNFLIKNIAPHIICNIVVAGKGIGDSVKSNYIPANVVIYDYFEDLSDLYAQASAVVVPIFKGSGMKVKIAEAMMHGKKILATTFAFLGYKIDPSCCSICNTASDFITEINNLDLQKYFFPESRKLFINNYSFDQNDMYYSRIN
jgi:glycosyltransferase involved in cell wall biosynthesis